MKLSPLRFTIRWIMIAVAVVGFVLWSAMVAEYHGSGRAYDAWVDTPSPLTIHERSHKPDIIESTSASAK
jgi:hypothetical protein